MPSARSVVVDPGPRGADDHPMTDAPPPVPPPPASVIPSPGPPGKVRSPVAVIIFSIITLGIYTLYWYYVVFEDLKVRTGQGVGGVVGLILGLCLSIVNWFLLPAEIGNMYAAEGLEKPVSGVTGFWNLIPLVGAIIWVVKVQNAMNRRWEASGAY
jgi:hypothetical protein